MTRYTCVAVTGGIGEGKSTVLGYLAAVGYRTASADALARSLFEDCSVHRELSRLVGVADVSRDQLRAALAGDSALRRAVNRLLHQPILDHLAEDSPHFVEVPLLIESCLQPLFRRVWVVTCGQEVQRERLMARYDDEALVVNLMSIQLATRAKSTFADRVVRTNEPEETVQALVIKAAERDFT